MFEGPEISCFCFVSFFLKHLTGNNDLFPLGIIYSALDAEMFRLKLWSSLSCPNNMSCFPPSPTLDNGEVGRRPGSKLRAILKCESM